MNTKILIIDDDPQDLKTMDLVLRREGYAAIHFAETGEEGLRSAESGLYDVILIDVVLNNVDGFDICRQLRDGGHSAKIIMVTGHLDAVDAQKARKSGANEIIEKKPEFPDLVPTIKSLC